jgi:hypothetical protein
MVSLNSHLKRLLQIVEAQTDSRQEWNRLGIAIPRIPRVLSNGGVSDAEKDGRHRQRSDGRLDQEHHSAVTTVISGVT